MKSRVLVLVGAVIYVIAWFVPVHSGLSSSIVPGWEAFKVALISPFDDADPWYYFPHVIASALSNFALVGALTLSLVARRSPPRLLRWILIVSALLNTHWLVLNEDRGDLKIGYYLWASSFFLIAVALVLEARRAESSKPLAAARLQT
jgi:hypothetical protein